MAKVDTGRCTLAVEDHGEGAAIVLLHGFPLAGDVWLPVLPALWQFGRVVVPDLRGFGDSEPTQAGYGMDELAADVLALCDRCGIERFVLCGHSMGGYVALALCAVAPERVRALALVASRAGADDEEVKARRRSVAVRIRAEGAVAYLEEALPALVAAANRARSPRLLAEARAMARRVAPDVLAAAQEGMAARPDRFGALAALEGPVLALGGADDPIVPGGDLAAAAAAARDGRAAVIPGAGHLPMLERPIATAEALAGFVRSLPTGG